MVASHLAFNLGSTERPECGQYLESVVPQLSVRGSHDNRLTQQPIQDMLSESPRQAAPFGRHPRSLVQPS